MLETITQSMAEPEQKNIAHHRLDMEAYQTYKHKDHVACILMLSNMRNVITLCFEMHHSAQIVWDAMKIQYRETSITRLRQLTLKFDGYKKCQNQTMRQYLTIMSNMISELKGVGHGMTDEQHVQAVIHSWEHMHINLTYNDNIKIFDDIVCHVELEENRLLAKKPVTRLLYLRLRCEEHKTLNIKRARARVLIWQKRNRNK